MAETDIFSFFMNFYFPEGNFAPKIRNRCACLAAELSFNHHEFSWFRISEILQLSVAARRLRTSSLSLSANSLGLCAMPTSIDLEPLGGSGCLSAATSTLPHARRASANGSFLNLGGLAGAAAGAAGALGGPLGGAVGGVLGGMAGVGQSKLIPEPKVPKQNLII